MIAVAIAFLRCASPIIRFFDDEPRVVAIAVAYVGVVAWSYAGLGTGVVLGSAITGSGATRTPLITDLAVILAVQLPASLTAVLAPGASLGRLWAAVAATYAVSGAVYAFVFRFAPWPGAARLEAR